MPWAVLLLVLSLLSGCVTPDSPPAGQTPRQIPESRESTALREMLRLASERALAELSRENDPSRQEAGPIELPQTLAGLSHSLHQYGLGHHLEKLAQQMNQGAGRATADMGETLLAAVDTLRIEDAHALVRGGEHAATQYFGVQMANVLVEPYQRLVHTHLQELGFHDQYRLVLDLYSTMPMNRRVSVNLEVHVVQQGMSRILQQMAEQEAIIRQAPQHQDSRLIEAVFGK